MDLNVKCEFLRIYSVLHYLISVVNMALQHDALECHASAQAAVHNHLKRTGYSLEFRPEERLGLVRCRIHR